VNARDTQEMVFRSDLVLASYMLADQPGTFEALESFSAAIEDLDSGRWNWSTINAVMAAHRIVNGGAA
jgi:hypothetical protein